MSEIRRLTKQIILPRQSVLMIHIGKCGGSTLKKALHESDPDGAIQFVHTEKPPIRKDLRYHIVARNPIRRALSAFNWRYKLVVEDGWQKARFAGEYGVLTKYETLNTLAGALYTSDGQPNLGAQSDFRKIHHLREDIAFYLEDLLASISPEQVLSVLMQENLNADLERVFGVHNDFHQKGNEAKQEAARLYLGAQQQANLKRFLMRDYCCLQTLYCWGKLSRDVLQAAL